VDGGRTAGEAVKVGKFGVFLGKSGLKTGRMGEIREKIGGFRDVFLGFCFCRSFVFDNRACKSLVFDL
jgi:hypothetical protein